MDAALPVLMTRLLDRSSLTRLLHAALRHDVAPVELSEAPRPGAFTLDVHVDGTPSVSLRAELAGVPQTGLFPLRLKPLHRAHAAELYALLEADPPPAEHAADSAAPREAPRLEEGSDTDDPSLGMSVLFDPEALATAEQTATPSHDDPTSSSFATATIVAEQATEAPTENQAMTADDFFFDEDFAKMPMALPGEWELTASHDPPPLFSPEGDGLAVHPTQAIVFDHVELEDVVGVPPPDDADNEDTLVRLPRWASVGDVTDVMVAASPAAGMPAGDDTRAVQAPVSSPIVVDEDLTKGDALLPPAKSSATESGRKKKTTRSGKSTGHGKKKTRHPTEDQAKRQQSAQAAPSSGRSKPAIAPGEAGEDPLVGRKIAEGKYTIAAAIGSGAAGAVYKATHRELRRAVAIKVLHPHYQNDPHFMKSFRGEALAASQLDHPNVMRVLDFGQEPDGLVYIVMEFLSGRTLQSLLDEERRLRPDRAAEIMIQVCAALSVAHDNGIIHRDIKPDNIMLVSSRNDEGGRFELVKVCDFGIAALQNPTREDAELGLPDNVIAGTPEYMSPEQARGREIDARSDVYACGICLYELITGRPPFLGEGVAEILVKQIEEEPRPPSQLLRGLDSIVEEIILRAIQKSPLKRQQSARELRVELKEIIDPGDGGGAHEDDERSIVENVPVLDDPASGFPGFFIALSSSIMRFGRFERGHPEAAQATKELKRATKAALRGRRELTFARRDSAKQVGFCVMTGHGEIVDLRRLLGSQLYGSFGGPFSETLITKGIAAVTLREGLPDVELQYIIEMLLAPFAHDELRKELLSKPLRHLSVLFVSDVIGRERKLSWKVGLCAARLARDLGALSNVRGISLKKMREIREDLVTGVAHLLTKGDEVRQFLFNADLVDESVEHLRGFSRFKVAPLVFERLLHDPCADAVTLLLADFDKGEIDPHVITSYLRAFATRLLIERSPKSDAAVTELYRRAIVTDADLPRDLQEQIRAQSLAEELVREPLRFLGTLDAITNADEYARELATLEAAMATLARRAEAPALLAAIRVLARHAKGTGTPGSRENHALRTMKSIIDKTRLVPIANALLTGPLQQREEARQLLVLAGSAGAHALYTAREGLTDASVRRQWVATFKETGPAGWSLLSAVLPRIEVRSETDVAFVEDLLRSLPDRLDPVLGETASKFLGHPGLRPVALAAIAPLLGERARKPLMDALEFADEPARIVAVTELRRIRAIDDLVVGVIERLLTMKGSATEELRVAAAAALSDVSVVARPRALALLSKGVEGKRGFVAMLRGEGGSEESVAVSEAMARSLFALDRAEGTRAIKARIAKSDPVLKARLASILQS